MSAMEKLKEEIHSVLLVTLYFSVWLGGVLIVIKKLILAEYDIEFKRLTVPLLGSLVLEKSFEGRDEHGGFIPSMIAEFQTVEGFDVWANVICISGALLVYNIFSVLEKIFGEGSLLRALLSPLPDES
ncbi:hypothetical protein [Desulfobacter sp.]|uniref:hypothetical protein n=1 Tax=Desulfobacter sp. TaxID=2294 RepID=UPI000E88642C|nr:hypothetical protein [Desulfobacter sp.]HBT87825.1 hypothetical protein [Desulfobacter sp.]